MTNPNVVAGDEPMDISVLLAEILRMVPEAHHAQVRHLLVNHYNDIVGRGTALHAQALNVRMAQYEKAIEELTADAESQTEKVGHAFLTLVEAVRDGGFPSVA